MTGDHLLHGLDGAQLAAVTSSAAPLAIVASAGSGKTTVLTRRIAHRIATGEALAQHVLALTFTRDAAAELRRRLRRLDLRDPVDTGTFHSVALRLLRDRALARNEAPPQIANDRLRLVREVLTQIGVRAEPYPAATDLDWARARMVPADRYEGACRLERRRSAVPVAKWAEFTIAYAQLKRRRGVLDFDDLLTDLLTALRTDSAWADGVRWRYRHFFVDEAQDLNPLQHAVLEALRDGRPDLCLVGDPRQAIYGWNGADHTLLAEVERYWPGVTVIALESNHRCSPQVVRAAAAVLDAAGQHDTTRSDVVDGPSVSIEGFDDEVAEAAAIARHVTGLLRHHSPSNLAVLARTNEQVTVLHRALVDAGAPTDVGVGRSPIERAVRTATTFTNREQLAAWVEATLAADALADGDDDHRRVALEADRYLTSGESGTFRSWIDARTPFDDLDDQQRDDAVSVLTFHAAKGREWWGVVVAGAEDGLVPHSSATTPTQLAEEARLFYVALTRASHRLLVTHVASRQRRVATPSRWLEAVRQSTEHDRPTPPPQRFEAPADPMVALREWRTNVARLSGLPERSVCSDRQLRSLLEHPPADVDELAQRLGITVSSAARLRPLPT